MIRIGCKPGISADGFRAGAIAVRAGMWKPADPNDPKVRGALLARVGTHLVIHPHDRGKLAGFGLELRGGRLVETQAGAAAVPTMQADPTPTMQAEAPARRTAGAARR